MVRTALLALTTFAATAATAADPYVIRVVDQDSHLGVPLVELRTVHNLRFYTDNAGVVAIDDANLLGQDVFFFVESHGYEFPKDGFGYRGTRLLIEAGKSADIKIHRVNIAERLYRITGAGLYEHAIRAGEKPPIAKPKINAKVVGCDSVQTAIYGDKLFWIWGDTSRLSYPLGNFNASAPYRRFRQKAA